MLTEQQEKEVAEQNRQPELENELRQLREDLEKERVEIRRARNAAQNDNSLTHEVQQLR